MPHFRLLEVLDGLVQPDAGLWPVVTAIDVELVSAPATGRRTGRNRFLANYAAFRRRGVMGFYRRLGTQAEGVKDRSTGRKCQHSARQRALQLYLELYLEPNKTRSQVGLTLVKKVPPRICTPYFHHRRAFTKYTNMCTKVTIKDRADRTDIPCFEITNFSCSEVESGAGVEGR